MDLDGRWLRRQVKGNRFPAREECVVGEGPGFGCVFRESPRRAHPDLALVIFEEARGWIGWHAIVRVVGPNRAGAVNELSRDSDSRCLSPRACDLAWIRKVRFVRGHHPVPGVDVRGPPDSMDIRRRWGPADVLPRRREPSA